MANTLTKINKKEDLETLVKDRNALARLDESKVDEFKKNFIELWNNQYLLSKAVPSELLEFCIQVSNLGLSVNPWHKQTYILPFKEKNGSFKLEAVFTKDGIKELCFSAGFQLEIDTIWNIQGKELRSRDLNLGDRARIDFTNTKVVNESFLGFYFELVDLNDKLRTQNVVVGVDYCKEVTKQLQSETHQIANYMHKAARKAYGEFFIPRSRGSQEVLHKLDNLNYKEDIIIDAKTEDQPQKELTLNIQKENEELKNYTVDDINTLYKSSTDTNKFLEVLQSFGENWRESPQDKLNEIYSTLSVL